MADYSRRQLAKYAVQQLASGQSKLLAEKLAASLISANRANQADLLIDDIKSHLERQALAVEVEVTSAHVISSATLAKITAYLKRLTNTPQINITTKIDKKLIGGVKIQTANRVWDLSIKKKLETLKESI